VVKPPSSIWFWGWGFGSAAYPNGWNHIFPLSRE
jgi:hypothetical protein